MRTGTALSAAEAARLTGVDKSTITRAVKDGKLSALKDENGRLSIEPAELFRVFPKAPEPDAASMHQTVDALSRIGVESAANSLESPDASTVAHQLRFEALHRELDEVRRGWDRERDERERERLTARETIDDLRTRLDASEEERRKKDAQVTHLLTDQREKAEASAAAAKRRWWWRRTG